MRSRWRELLSGLWFRPGLVIVGFGVLGAVLPAVDVLAAPDRIPYTFGGDAPAARTILATVASALVTVAGVSYSLTIVTLQLVSSQFSPRAGRELLADTTSQLTIGTLGGIFVYCLLVMRLVRDENAFGVAFVPALAVTMSIVFGIVGLAMLVLFIHTISRSIKVSNIAFRLAHGTLEAMTSLYPEPYRSELEDPATSAGAAPWYRDAAPLAVRAPRPGYVQRVELDGIVAAAPDGSRVHVATRPGAFVTERSTLVALWPAPPDADAFCDAVRSAVHIAAERDIDQDALYGIRQLVDIALRALSPGINDPTTAVTCIHYLGASIERLAGARVPPPEVSDAERGVRALVDRPDFAEHVREAFDELIRATDAPRVRRELRAALDRGIATAEAHGASARVALLRSMRERAATVAEPAPAR